MAPLLINGAYASGQMASDADPLPYRCRGLSDRLLYAPNLGIARSTNRKNRVLRAPATNDSCETSKDDPEGSPFAFWSPFRRDRVLRVPATKTYQ
jgi:hypothetical protein